MRVHAISMHLTYAAGSAPASSPSPASSRRRAVGAARDSACAKPKYIFPMEKASHEQKKAIKRRYDEVKIDAPLQALGRPLTGPEKRARKEAGRDGPQGPPAI